jgi:cation diffusion facilitator family transporter
VAAFALTGMKLTVGWATNSLGILSEAAHSGLDLVAAGITLWAVHISGRPADQDHTYGHGKFENLSALVETLLLLATCVWIIYEAIRRLFFEGNVEVDATIWAFLVVIVSIVIDFGRSRALLRVARKYQSQALEADALHFSTDIWSSLVVLGGLTGVRLAQSLNLPWLERADAVAAMGVAVLVIWVSFQLGRKAVDDLLDRVPHDLQEEVAAAAKVPGVEDVKQVRVRRSGPEVFADVTLTVDRGAAFEGAHDIADEAEQAVRSRLPKADIVVHVEPVASSTEEATTTIRLLASRRGLGAHGIRFYEDSGTRSLELHLEVNENLSLEEAHRRATDFEKAIREAMPELTRIVTHLEPTGDRAATLQAEPAGAAQVRKAIWEFVTSAAMTGSPHDIHVQMVGGELTVSFHCSLDPATGITEAHTYTQQLETYLRSRVPNLGRVVIHVEPLE